MCRFGPRGPDCGGKWVYDEQNSRPADCTTQRHQDAGGTGQTNPGVCQGIKADFNYDFITNVYIHIVGDQTRVFLLPRYINLHKKRLITNIYLNTYINTLSLCQECTYINLESLQIINFESFPFSSRQSHLFLHPISLFSVHHYFFLSLLSFISSW